MPDTKPILLIFCFLELYLLNNGEIKWRCDSLQDVTLRCIQKIFECIEKDEKNENIFLRIGTRIKIANFLMISQLRDTVEE